MLKYIEIFLCGDFLVALIVIIAVFCVPKIFNVFGEDITGIEREFQDPSFGEMGSDGELHPYWTGENDDVDDRGFNKHHVEPNGEYKMEVELPKGTRLIRYGHPGGWLTAPIGTPYELLGLPWKMETVEYHEYEATSDGVVLCLLSLRIARPPFV